MEVSKMKTKRNDGYTVLIAAFYTETNENKMLIGEGFTLIEAVVRALEFELSDQEFRNIIQFYGPDDFTGLCDWYISRGIYISEPWVLEGGEGLRAIE
jgi:hypothetical protein